MYSHPDFEKCLHFINSEAWTASTPSPTEEAGKPLLTLTISRQSGSGAHSVAACLATYLQQRLPANGFAWSVFDRNLVEKVLEDHQLPMRIARFMPEDRVPELADAFDELLGFHPPSWTLVQQTAETILRLARRGNAIVIGRGAHVIARQIPHAFHVRLVAPLHKRIEHVQKMRSLTRKEAATLVREEDRGRERYLKKYFGEDLNDPLSYHLVINTDSMPYDKAARVIGEAALDHLSNRAQSTKATNGAVL